MNIMKNNNIIPLVCSRCCLAKYNITFDDDIFKECNSVVVIMAYIVLLSLVTKYKTNKKSKLFI